MIQTLTDYFRCPEEFVRLRAASTFRSTAGYFRLGEHTICYGHCAVPVPDTPAEALPDVSPLISQHGGTVSVPFDPAEVIESLRAERYQNARSRTSHAPRLLKSSYYWLRPLLPVHVRKHLQRFHLRDWQSIKFPAWPVDTTVDRIFTELMACCIRTNNREPIPFVWFWPEGYAGCAIMTHDVEQESGRAFCGTLMDIDDRYGIKSSFQLVPEERYAVGEAFLERIRARGFEVNVHDLNHDGMLFDSRDRFVERAAKINRYAKSFGAEGFRAGATYRNADWFSAFEFLYDMSVPNVAHLEPQRGGCCTVMPYSVGPLTELPLTAAEDYSLFHILGQYTTALWRTQLDLILERNGLATFVVHPDYILEPRARGVYLALLEHLAALREAGVIWLPLPKDVARWWRGRSRMQVVRSACGWKIVGRGSERARLAFAMLDGDRLVYQHAHTQRAAA